MNTLKLKTLSLAVAAALVSPVTMAETTVYGIAHLSFANTDDDNGSAIAIASHSSRFGVKGSMGDEGETKVIYKLEWQVDMADNSSSTGIKSRSQYAGLKGGFGEVRIGRDDSPYKNAGKKAVEFFSDTYADYNNIVDKGQDTRSNDSISYATKLGPGKLSVMYAAGDDSTTAENAGDSTVVAYDMKSGAFTVGVATQSINDSAVAGNTETGTKVVVGYDINSATKVGVLFETVSDDNDTVDDTNTLVSVKHNMGDNAVKFVYGMKDQGLANDATMTALAYDMKINKNTSAYFLVANGTDNGLKADSEFDGDATVAGVGMIVKF